MRAQVPGKATLNRTIHFRSGKADLTPRSRTRLDELAAFVKANPQATIHVDGYTDAVGGNRYNMRLSQRRANAVVRYLVQKDGVPLDRIKASAFGKKRPVATNRTEAGRRQNRRATMTAAS